MIRGDEIKSNHSYDWARSLHYMDTHDAPPRRCLAQVSTDCTDGCVVSAIQNYTSRLLRSNNFRDESLKFLVHFIGDIHQPLHACGRDKGVLVIF